MCQSHTFRRSSNRCRVILERAQAAQAPSAQPVAWLFPSPKKITLRSADYLQRSARAACKGEQTRRTLRGQHRRSCTMMAF
jgi:hypothetical protein